MEIATGIFRCTIKYTLRCTPWLHWQVDYQVGIKYIFFFTILCIFKCSLKWDLTQVQHRVPPQVHYFIESLCAHLCSDKDSSTWYVHTKITKIRPSPSSCVCNCIHLVWPPLLYARTFYTFTPSRPPNKFLFRFKFKWLTISRLFSFLLVSEVKSHKQYQKDYCGLCYSIYSLGLVYTFLYTIINGNVTASFVQKKKGFEIFRFKKIFFCVRLQPPSWYAIVRIWFDPSPPPLCVRTMWMTPKCTTMNILKCNSIDTSNSPFCSSLCRSQVTPVGVSSDEPSVASSIALTKAASSAPASTMSNASFFSLSYASSMVC